MCIWKSYHLKYPAMNPIITINGVNNPNQITDKIWMGFSTLYMIKGVTFMKKGQAIQNKLKLNKLLEKLKEDSQEIYYLALLSFNFGLSIKEAASLTHKDLESYREQYKDEVPISNLWNKMNLLLSDWKESELQKSSYIFASLDKGNDLCDDSPEHLDLDSALKIISEKARSVGIDDFGNESLCRSFAYFHYQKFRDIDRTKELLDKVSPTATLHYMGYQNDRYLCFHCNRGCIYRKKYK